MITKQMIACLNIFLLFLKKMDIGKKLFQKTFLSLNAKHGRGINTWADGGRYEGGYVDGKKHGHGAHTWPNGDHYEGEYERDLKHGYGIYTWPNGDRYEGECEQNLMHGRASALGQMASAMRWRYVRGNMTPLTQLEPHR